MFSSKVYKIYSFHMSNVVVLSLDISVTTPIIVVVNFLNFENTHSQFVGFVLLPQIYSSSPLNDITWPKLERSAGI